LSPTPRSWRTSTRCVPLPSDECGANLLGRAWNR
jgi:hypothetical protein